ncbi:MAG: hypothetical protein AAGC56_07920 [Pseudomonadota bacterium]
MHAPTRPTAAALKRPLDPLARSVGYFQDLRFERDGIHVPQTGARIRLNGAFLRSALSVIEIYSYIVGLGLLRLARGRRAHATIAFHPRAAAPWYNIWSVAQLAGLRTISDVAAADHVVVFEDATYTNAAQTLPEGLAARAVNARVDNIAKQYVADLFEDVFGYALAVDPTRFTGRAIRKSQANGVHDGVEIDCPIPASAVRPGYAYQRLVDSTVDGETSEDLRVAVAFGALPAVFHKRKSLEKRFGTEYLSVALRDAETVFSPTEIDKLVTFCDRIGLDFGAIDVMRDKTDGRIYVVDVNKTCMPVLTLPFGKQIAAYRRIAKAFAEGLAARSSGV